MAPSANVMPGEYPFHFSYLDHQNAATTSISGANSNLFKPPRTPSVSASSSLLLTRSRANSAMSADYTHVSNASRKRTRQDYNDGRQTPTREEVMYGVESPGSPVPFVNTRYIIKGGMDTPSLAAAQLYESVGEHSDVGYRRELSGVSTLLGEETGGYQSFLPLDLDGESSVHSLRSSRQMNGPGDGWSKTAMEVVGGVVGKVWEFCKAGAFRGFHAGGGKGYSFRNSDESSQFTLVEETNSNFWGEEKITTAWDRESTPLPGQFPEDDFIPNYMDNPTPERPGKRRQISGHGDDLARNWVVVPPVDNVPKPAQPRSAARYSMPTNASTSRRTGPRPAPASRAGSSLGAGRRPLLQRVSHAGSPSLNNLQGASFASPRSPGGKIPRAVGTSSRSGSPSPTKATGTSRGNLGFSPKMDSPAAVEAQRWATVKKREEREADVTIRRLDAQMKAMIREAKEALGTKIEVEIQDDPVRVSTPTRRNKRWGV